MLHTIQYRYPALILICAGKIYSTGFAGAFNDITNGTNPGCGTVGFKTAKGWDPVTGK
jgi:hypothetical protein